MMFDSTNFSIAVMTDKGFEKVSSNHVKYNYAWKYNKEVSGDKAEKRLQTIIWKSWRSYQGI